MQAVLTIPADDAELASKLTHTPTFVPAEPFRVMSWKVEFEDGCVGCLEILPPEEDGNPCFTSMTLYEPEKGDVLSEVGSDDGESPWRTFQVKRGKTWYEIAVEIG